MAISNKAKRPISILSAIALIAIAAVFSTANPANAADHSVSIAAYCEKNVSSGNLWVKSRAVNINNRWDGWRCARANGTLTGVDVAKACQQQIGKKAKAVRVNLSWSGWRCRV